MKPNIRLAKKLRKGSTETENFLWRYLKAKRFEGYKFRRQEPIGKYIVDFVCFEKRIVIECDGGQHSFQIREDRSRDEWFRMQGYQVLRFWDNEVFQKTESILQVIWEACQKQLSLLNLPLSPALSHKGRGKNE